MVVGVGFSGAERRKRGGRKMNGGRTHGKRREIENVIDPIPVIVTDLITVIPIKFCGKQRSRRLLRTTQTNVFFF
jgi:hypothetical protein